MPESMQIRELSIVDRLRLIEEVWASLSSSPEAVPVPDWHHEELDRRLAVDEGDGEAKEWDEAKREILTKLRK
jgi:putative addiction module component (TIGR02574 family)